MRAAGHRADGGDVEVVGIDRRLQFMPGHRQHAPGGLVAPHAAVVRRVADGRADVAAQFQPGEAGRQCRCRAAGRSARRAAGVPGVAGGAVHRVEALPVGQRDRHVGLAEQHRAGGLQALHQQRVASGDVAGVGRVAVGGGQPGHVEALLHRDRQAVQRAPALAARQGRIGGAGTVAGAVGIQHHHRVDRAAQAADAAQVVVQQFQCGQLAPAQAAGQFMGGQKGQIGHRGSRGWQVLILSSRGRVHAVTPGMAWTRARGMIVATPIHPPAWSAP